MSRVSDFKKELAENLELLEKRKQDIEQEQEDIITEINDFLENLSKREKKDLFAMIDNFVITKRFSEDLLEALTFSLIR